MVASLVAASERDALVLRILKQAVPPPLRGHCLHATLDARTLVITTDSPVWGSRLRFLSPELVKAMGELGRVDSVRVRIQLPGGTRRQQDTGVQRRLSEATVGHLLEAAVVVGDVDLAEAYRRLARAGGRRS
jgi:hypothetical protein